MNRGAKVVLELQTRTDFALFSEGGGRVVISFAPEDTHKVFSFAKSKNLPIKKIGTVEGNKLELNDLVSIDVNDLASVYYKVLPSKFAVSFAV